jgi:site-specific DNA-cytosine methylase
VRPETPPKKRPRRGSIEASLGTEPAAEPLVFLHRPSLPAEPLVFLHRPSLPAGKKYVIDLFCGIGGFSCGAEAAGHTLLLAVDSDRRLLQSHADNHPNCHHLLMTLGREVEDALVEQIQALVPHGQPWHLHGSPPCVKVSAIQHATLYRNHQGRTHDGNIEEGMELVNWYLRLVVRLRPASWTFENVVVPEVSGAVRMLRTLYPSLVDFKKRVNFSNYGLGQHRTRCIAGSPGLIHRMLTDTNLHTTPPVMRDVLAIPDGAGLVKNPIGKTPEHQHTIAHEDGTYSNDTVYNSCYRTVDQVAPCCLAGNPLVWAQADYITIRTFSPREQAAVQSFPPDYALPAVATVAYRGLGNAVPPLFAQKLMSVA